MSTTDWRGLCEELVQLDTEQPSEYADWKKRWNAAIKRARAALAQPEPEGVGTELTDKELLALASGLPLNPDDDDILSLQRSAIAADRARFGRPAPAPAGEVAELVQPPGRTGLTWQRVIEGLRDVLNDESENAIQRVWQRSRILDAISVMEANPCPASTPAGEMADSVAVLEREAEAVAADTDAILALAAIIREVDGDHSLGAAALAEAILSHPGSRWVGGAPAPAGEVAELVLWLRLERHMQPHLYARLTRAADLLESQANLAQEVWDLVSDSQGVFGLHLNGDLAPWEELLPGGRFERLPSLPPASNKEVES